MLQLRKEVYTLDLADMGTITADIIQPSYSKALTNYYFITTALPEMEN